MANILITGSSSGIGRSTALLLARKGHTVFAGVRNSKDGEDLKKENSKIIPVILDVCKEDQIQKAFEQISAHGLDALINNAGIAIGGPLEFIKIEDFRNQMEINVIGQVAVTQKFLPLLTKSRGRIVFVGSMSGFFTWPLFSPYSASKHALEAVADALRREVRDIGVKVVLVQPGAIKTSIWDKGQDYVQKIRKSLPERAEKVYGPVMKLVEKRISWASKNGVKPDLVAEVILDSIKSKNPKARYLVGKDARIAKTMSRWIPDRTMDKMISWAISKEN